VNWLLAGHPLRTVVDVGKGDEVSVIDDDLILAAGVRVDGIPYGPAGDSAGESRLLSKKLTPATWVVLHEAEECPGLFPWLSDGAAFRPDAGRMVRRALRVAYFVDERIDCERFVGQVFYGETDVDLPEDLFD